MLSPVGHVERGSEMLEAGATVTMTWTCPGRYKHVQIVNTHEHARRTGVQAESYFGERKSAIFAKQNNEALSINFNSI